MKIDLIIPVYKPDKKFMEMVDLMSDQSLSLNKIIIMNVEQKYFERLIFSTKFIDRHKNIEVHHLSKREFDAGKTRNLGVKLSDADYFIMMNQNAMPSGKEVVAKLLRAFEAEKSVAVAYARQVPIESAPDYDKYIRRYYFPEDSAVRSLKDTKTIGWQTYMNSNVCAMYSREAFDALGGFINHAICNEDVLFASRAVNEGYKISYVADAVVVLTEIPDDKEHEKLSFDRAVSIVKHPETFDLNAIREENKKLEKMTINHLRRNGHHGEVLEYRRIARKIRKGFSRGLKYKRLAYMDLEKYSANPEYWHMDEILRDRNSVDVHAGYGRSEAERMMISTPPVMKNIKKEEN